MSARELRGAGRGMMEESTVATGLGRRDRAALPASLLRAGGRGSLRSLGTTGDRVTTMHALP